MATLCVTSSAADALARAYDRALPLEACGFMLGGVSNYALNRIWTFGSRRNPFVEGVQFLTVSAIALVAGKIVFVAAGRIGFSHFTTTWFVATLAGTFVNFFLNKYWTFRHLN